MSTISFNFGKAAKILGAMGIVGGVFFGLDKFLDVVVSDIQELRQTETTTKDGKAPQGTAEFIVTNNDRRYTIWDGLVVEELTNSTPHVYTQGSLGKRVYDFDLRVITHTSDEAGGDLEVTLFSDSAVNGKDAPHIEHVRKMGCLVADGYFARAAAGTHEMPPFNVAGFRERHCTPAGP